MTNDNQEEEACLNNGEIEEMTNEDLDQVGGGTQRHSSGAVNSNQLDMINVQNYVNQVSIVTNTASHILASERQSSDEVIKNIR